MSDIPSIPDFFYNKSILITGGSGFIGKVIVEKLLRSCPGLKSIYILMRPKKGKSSEERIKLIVDLPIFDVLKTQNPDAINKIRVVDGNVREVGLGLSVNDRKLLTEEVNAIIHAAASVRFDDSLTDAILLNTRGTREAAKLALDTKKLDVFVHISTTYCNIDQVVVEEKLYPSHADWEQAIEIAENMDKHTLNILTRKYIHPLPNTYTFSKSLAEHVVYDMINGKIPTVIFRPSIVISTIQEPFPGWVETFNGPVALLTAVASGVIRTMYADPNNIMDYVPVDVISKFVIVSAWKQATSFRDGKSTLSIYNGSNNNQRNVTIGETNEIGKKLNWEIPLNYIMWYPNNHITKCIYYYWFRIYLYQIVPAFVLDGLLKLFGYEPLLARIQRRIYLAVDVLQYFMNNQWQFINDQALSLIDAVQSSDRKDFSFNAEDVDIMEFMRLSALGARRYLLKYSDDTLEIAKKVSRTMWMLSKMFNFLWYFGFLWIIFFYYFDFNRKLKQI